MRKELIIGKLCQTDTAYAHDFFAESEDKSQIAFQVEKKCTLSRANPFTCITCLGFYYTKTGLISHIFSHISNVYPPHLTCTTGKDGNHFVVSKVTQVKTEELNIRFDCAKCKECFISRGLLTSHVFSHECDILSPLHVCPGCGDVFMYTNKLYQHVSTCIVTQVKHENDYMFSSVAKKKIACSRKKKINKHQMVCDICQKAFVTLYRLKRHMFLHTGEKPFQCNVCEKTFNRSSSLKRHLHTHQERSEHERIYECEHCFKVLSSSSMLKAHQVVHTGERPYSCSICEKTFAWAGDLIKHHRVHTGERPFKCDVCGKTFLRASYLRNHSYCHSGAKPFKCDECDKLFARVCHLRTHRNMKHGILPFKCGICGKSFIHSIKLKEHQLIHASE